MSRLTDEATYCLMRCADDFDSFGEECKLYKFCFERKMYDKLKHYEDLEELQRLIELPCKVGDTVWVVGSRCLADEEPDDWCEYHDCDECSYGMKYTVFERKTNAYLAYSMTLGDSSNFIWGKTVFATKAEAEEALKRMQDNE